MDFVWELRLVRWKPTIFAWVSFGNYSQYVGSPLSQLGFRLGITLSTLEAHYLSMDFVWELQLVRWKPTMFAWVSFGNYAQYVGTPLSWHAFRLGITVSTLKAHYLRFGFVWELRLVRWKPTISMHFVWELRLVRWKPTISGWVPFGNYAQYVGSPLSQHAFRLGITVSTLEAHYLSMHFLWELRLVLWKPTSSMHFVWELRLLRLVCWKPTILAWVSSGNKGQYVGSPLCSLGFRLGITLSTLEAHFLSMHFVWELRLVRWKPTILAWIPFGNYSQYVGSPLSQLGFRLGITLSTLEAHYLSLGFV